MDVYKYIVQYIYKINGFKILLKNLFFIFIFIGLGNSFSQEFFGVGVDNDLYFLDDHYYSNGIFLKYGKLKTSSDSINTKYIFWELGQKIFNPSKRFTKAVEEYDYPYGGWLYLKFSKQTILKNNSFFQWGIQTGYTGDGSLARQLQNTYHKIFLKIEEMPWTDQMPASFHVNFLLDYFKSYKLNSAMKFKTHFFDVLVLKNQPRVEHGLIRVQCFENVIDFSLQKR